MNLAPAGAADLELLAFANYGHYTSMQVRDGRIRGLDLHLERLDTNARELFGRAAGESRLLEALRHAVPMSGAWSVRVTVFSRELTRVVAGDPVDPDIMVSVTAGAAANATALRVLPVRYEREMPQVKHLATYGLLRQMRAARAANYNDALFVNAAGQVPEGSTWNICFTDGTHWRWPAAPALQGVTMQLLRTAMRDAGWPVSTGPILLSDLEQYTGAFATNSVTAARPISAVGEQPMPHSVSNEGMLRDLFDAVPWTSL